MVADYDARTAVERELVLRLASLLWRLRRSIAIETDLFQSQAEAARDQLGDTQVERRQSGSPNRTAWLAHDCDAAGPVEMLAESNSKNLRFRELTASFLRLTEMDGGAFERLNRYEARLWRQAVQTLIVLQSIRLR